MDNIFCFDIEVCSDQQMKWMDEYYLNEELTPKEKIHLRSLINGCKNSLSPQKSEIVQIGTCSYEGFMNYKNLENNKYLLQKNLIGQNIKFDLKFLFRNNPQDIPIPLWDTKIASQLLGNVENDLKSLVKKYCEVELDKDLEVRIAPWHIFDKLEKELQLRLYNYLKNDVVFLPKIYLKQLEEIERPVSTDCMNFSSSMELEMKLIPVLARMELNGITIDKQKFQNYKQNTENKIEELKEILFNTLSFKNSKGLNSPKQLKEALSKLGIVVINTREEELINKGPLTDLILDYKGLFKLNNTYFNGMIKSSNDYEEAKDTFKIYGEYKQLGAESGRITSDLLQVFPKTIEFREMFIASTKDKVLVSLDMSQIEPRIFGQFIGPGKFREFLKEHEDPYMAIALSSGMEDTARKKVKEIVLGIMYGKKALAISLELGIEKEEAQEIINWFYKQFPEAKAWIKGALSRSKVILPSGRTIHNTQRQGRRSQEGAIINRYIQGRAAELNKESLINLDHSLLPLWDSGVRMLMTIHDEVLVEVPNNELALDVAYLVENTFWKTHMVGLPDVPIHCAAKIISNWGESL